MVDDIVNLLTIKFMKDGYCHSPVGEGGEEGGCPSRTVAAAQCDFVTTFHTAVLKHDMELFYLAGHIVELQGGTLIVGQGIKVPVVDDAVLY